VTIHGVSAVFLDGPCLFLTCLETGVHGHDVCPECGAVRFGNVFCRTCLTRCDGLSAEFRAELLSNLDRAGGAGPESGLDAPD